MAQKRSRPIWHQIRSVGFLFLFLFLLIKFIFGKFCLRGGVPVVSTVPGRVWPRPKKEEDQRVGHFVMSARLLSFLPGFFFFLATRPLRNYSKAVTIGRWIDGTRATQTHTHTHRHTQTCGLGRQVRQRDSA